MKTLRINGEPQKIAADNLEELMRERAARQRGKGRGLVVAVNRTIVREVAWPSTALADGDQIEIIRPVMGG